MNKQFLLQSSKGK